MAQVRGAQAIKRMDLRYFLYEPSIWSKYSPTVFASLFCICYNPLHCGTTAHFFRNWTRKNVDNLEFFAPHLFQRALYKSALRSCYWSKSHARHVENLWECCLTDAVDGTLREKLRQNIMVFTLPIPIERVTVINKLIKTITKQFYVTYETLSVD